MSIDVGRTLDTLECVVGELKDHARMLTEKQKEQLVVLTEQVSNLSDTIGMD